MKMATILNNPLLVLTLCILGCVRGCVERERLALLDFKSSFPSSLSQNHGKLSSWSSSDQDCCSWEGITCHQPTSPVASLDLSNQGLQSYQLRPSVLELQHLTSLDLSENNFTMRILEFIGSLSKLTNLDMSNAGFFGKIPPQLGNLSNLQTLYLGSSNFSIENFQWLSHLSSLETLDMSSTNINEARDWLSMIVKLPALSDFTCNSCHFPTPEFPSTFSSVNLNSSSSLQTLRISDSTLTYTTLSVLMNNTYNLSVLYMESLNLKAPFVNIFGTIGNLCNLELLLASGCSLNMSLVDILQPLASGCASTSLQFLDLSLNNLIGTIPPMLKFQSLSGLHLNDNRLESFVPQISTLSSGNLTSRLFPASLSELSVSHNTLSGILSNEHFTNFSQLSTLDLGDNLNLSISFSTRLKFGFLQLGSQVSKLAS